uniref:Crp/Fnr family transcriptional regulator n=1 Tax=uncultured Polaribacter sp. TaxID=174711 RepID=UPI002603FA1C|nr:Crp/Fnr family transcriptional regulator [uncultured Polaribacter sp.]
MKSNNSIALEIFKNISLSKKEIDFIDSKFEKISLTKGDVLLSSDTHVTNQYYVFSGCLRSFFLNSLGKDHTTQFAVKDWWISDYISFFTEEKSVMTIECLQDAEIYRLSRKDMNSLCEEIPKIETFFRNKMEKAFASFQKRILEYLSLTAKERYIKFITTYPEIEQCVKNYHIASYLGITTESLSRIRKIII